MVYLIIPRDDHGHQPGSNMPYFFYVLCKYKWVCVKRECGRGLIEHTVAVWRSRNNLLYLSESFAGDTRGDTSSQQMFGSGTIDWYVFFRLLPLAMINVRQQTERGALLDSNDTNFIRRRDPNIMIHPTPGLASTRGIRRNNILTWRQRVYKNMLMCQVNDT